MAREGLERLDGVASVDEDPDLTNRTARVYLKKRRWLAPAQISKHVEDLHIGATLRGVEATVQGTVIRKGEDLLLRVSGLTQPLKLVPLCQKVQQNPATKAPQPITVRERHAYAGLLEQLQHRGAKRACITGVLVGNPGGLYQLQVRKVVWR